MPATGTIDLRSDTVTQPTDGMRDAIRAAPVGDDVFGDDPSVIQLQEKVAALLGKEAALYVPSGTMSNAIAVRIHTSPGDEIIVESTSHIYIYEGGGYAAISGVSIALVPGVNGIMKAADIEKTIRSKFSNSHFPTTTLVCVENTHNRGGGKVYTVDDLNSIAAVVRKHGLKFHCDGARLWNAAVRLGVPMKDLAAPFDTISVCLSKGMGCPVGSLLVGSRDAIARAHRVRKMLGGGMRQAGLLAAAGLYALEHNFERLADDHRRCQEIAAHVAQLPGFHCDPKNAETNMLFINIDPEVLKVPRTDSAGAEISPSQSVLNILSADHGIRIVNVSDVQVRVVIHLHADDASVERVNNGFSAISSKYASSSA